MDGLAVGSACYREPAAAAQAVCSRVLQPLSNGGMQSCDLAEPFGAGQVSLVVKTWSPTSGAIYQNTHVQLQPCDPDGLSELGIEPEAVAYVYSWGLVAVLSVWAIGYAIGAAVKAVRMA